MKQTTFSASKGISYYGAVEECKAYLRQQGLNSMVMRFNGIEINVNKDSLPFDLSVIYDLRCRVRSLTER